MIVHATARYVSIAGIRIGVRRQEFRCWMQVLALYGCLAWVQLSSRPDYILVIDCGSTGTRM